MSKIKTSDEILSEQESERVNSEKTLFTWATCIEAMEEYADQFKPKWIMCIDRLPEQLDNCLFVVDLPNDHRHGKVYGGVYTGDPSSKNAHRRNEFSTPGVGFTASEWMLSPEPPQRGDSNE